MAEEEEIKGLPPEEKIKRLKETEEKKRKEIEEAQKMLREAEKELTDKEEWQRKVPIPQVAAEEVEEMSEAEKEIVKAHRGIRGKKAGREEEEEKSFGEKGGRRKSGEESLEEAVAKERAELPPELRESEYARRLSQEPIEELYQELRGIRQEAEERGYISPEMERRAEYRIAAMENKLEDIEEGRYSLTEEVAEKALLTKAIGLGISVIGDYRRRDLYRR